MIGLSCKLYYDPAGIGSTPTWVEITNAQDVGLPLTADEVEASTRGGGGFKQFLAGLIDAGITWTMVWVDGDTDITALRTAFLSRAPIGLAVMTGGIAAAGSEGLWLDVIVTGFDRQEPLNGAVTVAITVKPALTENTPQWKVITE